MPNVPRLNSLTPVLIVDSVETCIGFWWDRFGFTVENVVSVVKGLQ